MNTLRSFLDTGAVPPQFPVKTATPLERLEVEWRDAEAEQLGQFLQQDLPLQDASFDFIPIPAARALPATRAKRMLDWKDGSEVENFYHGTSKDFQTFDPSRNSQVARGFNGVYVTRDADVADGYVNMFGREGQDNIIPLQGRTSNLANSHTILPPEVVQQLNISDKVKQRLIDSPAPTRLMDVTMGHGNKINDIESAAANSDILQSLGYDGIDLFTETIFFAPKDLKGKFSSNFSNAPGMMD